MFVVDTHIASSLHQNARVLQRNLARSNLYHALKHRPTLSELQQRKIYIPEDEYEGVFACLCLWLAFFVCCLLFTRWCECRACRGCWLRGGARDQSANISCTSMFVRVFWFMLFMFLLVTRAKRLSAPFQEFPFDAHSAQDCCCDG